jgi:SOS-response transcriptional repressor LexA
VEPGGCSASEPFALRVLGDSMEPEFTDGSVIVIDPDGVVRDGAFVFADVHGEYIFRQLRIRDSQLLLRPLNRGYPTLELDGLNAIKGVVVQRAARRRSGHKHYP